MITAREAKINVINHESVLYNKYRSVAEELLEEMNISIEFHSKNGFETIEFEPYDTFRFHTDHAKKIASDVFEKTLKENGFTIEKNNWSTNILKISW